jgi:8-oxo-dGTP diphosphatase
MPTINRDGHTPLPVVAGLIHTDGKWLIARRGAGDPLGPVWEFPGGTIESGESAAAALKRELMEELGIEVVVGDLVTEVCHDYPHLSIHLSFMLCEIVAGDPRGLEGQEVAWRSIKEIGQLEFPAADEKVLALLPELGDG